jgi:hypothetical protein
MAADRDFFHWKLEFPDAFYSVDGEKRANPGFDAVVGNPPWIDFQKIEEKERKFHRKEYQSAIEKYDIYTVFTEKAAGLMNNSGLLGFIIQNKFLSSSYGEGLKSYLHENVGIKKLLDFEDAPIFEGTTTYPLILILSSESQDSFGYAHLADPTIEAVVSVLSGETELVDIPFSDLDPERAWIFPTAEQQEVIDTIQSNSDTTIGEVAKDIPTGVKTNAKGVYVFNQPKDDVPVESELLRPVVDGADIRRYSVDTTDKYILYPYEIDSDRSLTPVDISDYPKAESHLADNKTTLSERKFFGKTVTEMGKEWFEFPYTSEELVNTKVIYPHTAPEPRSSVDLTGDTIILNTGYGIVLPEDTEFSTEFLCAIINSPLFHFLFQTRSPMVSGGYYQFRSQYMEGVPVADLKLEDSSISHDRLDELVESDEEPDRILEQTDSDRSKHDLVAVAVRKIRDLKQKRGEIHLDFLSMIGTDHDGPLLADLGVYQPKADDESIVNQKTRSKPKLEIIDARVESDDSGVTIDIQCRHKPSGDDDYTESEFVTVAKILDLSETEQSLLEAYVPAVVAEPDRVSDFRTNAAQTISPADRIEELRLPVASSVESGIDRFEKARDYARGLDERIQSIDELINQVVYDLYDLTDEEIELVEQAVED